MKTFTTNNYIRVNKSAALNALINGATVRVIACKTALDSYNFIERPINLDQPFFMFYGDADDVSIKLDNWLKLYTAQYCNVKDGRYPAFYIQRGL